MIPWQRIMEKLDEFADREDYDGLEKLLLYWYGEAEMSGDGRGLLLVCNELTGHYRKSGDQEKAFRYADQSVKLLKVLEMEQTVSAGTTYLNAATAYSAFGENAHALELFGMAQAAYMGGSADSVSPGQMGGLYNNMGLALHALGRYEEAVQMYDKAMGYMEQVSNAQPEQAITCLNKADSLAAGSDPELVDKQVSDLIEKAYMFLTDPSVPRNGYYAFVCDKCAPGFLYHGFFAEAEVLRNAAEEIRKNRQ